MGQGSDKHLESSACGVTRGVWAFGRALWGLPWAERVLLCAERVQHSGASGEMLWACFAWCADEGGGFEPEQSCKFLFQMVRVSSQAQSFLFLFTSMCLVIS